MLLGGYKGKQQKQHQKRGATKEERHHCSTETTGAVNGCYKKKEGEWVGEKLKIATRNYWGWGSYRATKLLPRQGVGLQEGYWGKRNTRGSVEWRL